MKLVSKNDRESRRENSVKIAVLLPCYNEAAAIGNTVKAFQTALPDAAVYVYDNNSSDNTIEVARAAGAIVRTEPRQGKGNVVRRMFADIDADIYVLADGDQTYDAAAAPKLIEHLQKNHCDMVVGTRASNANDKAYRPGHRFGNALFNKFIRLLFEDRFTDVLSGYRVFSRRFVKSFPALARGFDIEVELTIHTLELRLPIDEVPTQYFSRPENSNSKLRSVRDGLRILYRILLMFKETRPLLFFSLIGMVLSLAAVGLAIPLFITYAKIGLVPRYPTAVLVTGLGILSCISFTCGVVLDSVGRCQKERKYLNYLNQNNQAL